MLATICHHGSTLRTLVECTKWSVTHRCMVHAWEAMLRHQINSFLMSLSDDEVHHVGSDFSEIIVNVLSSLILLLNRIQCCMTEHLQKIFAVKRKICFYR